MSADESRSPNKRRPGGGKRARRSAHATRQEGVSGGAVDQNSLVPLDGTQSLPALRPIEILPFRREDDEVYFALQDPLQFADSLAISATGYFVLAHLDGVHTAAEIAEAFQRQAQLELPEAEIMRLVDVLDEALLLQSPRFDAALAKRRAAYAAAPARDNRQHALPTDELRQMLETILAAGKAAPVAELRGLLVPHLDYPRGTPCYADGYATLAAALARTRVDRFVILGTNHAGLSAGAVATTKDFLTPLGRVPTDRDFIRRLEERLGCPLCTNEVDHLTEHSVELQVHFLQVLAGDRPFEIVPVLCPDVCGPTGTAPRDGGAPDLETFADTLGALIDADNAAGRRTVIIAGADLSHVGQRFGEEAPTTPEYLASVGELDRRLLDLLENRREHVFRARLAEAENPTRICSTGCVYALLRALPGQPFRLLRYHQAVSMELETHVTCAAGIVGETA